jgi:S1-C subfamily serine protease
MSISPDDGKSLFAIRARAKELGAPGERDLHTADAEVLAALADGTLAFEDVDDATLERCIQAFGTDSVVEVLIRGTGQADERSRQGSVISMMEDRVTTQKTHGAQERPSARRLGFASWWTQRPVWIAAAAAIVLVATGVFLTLRQQTSPTPSVVAETPTPEAEASLALQWPSDAPFDPATLGRWGLARALLPQTMPDFSQTTGVTLGAGGDPRFTRWRQATVIVRLEGGWGSGAFISPDGWILTNYHVVDSVAQAAAISGEAPVVQIITAEIVNGQAKPSAPLRARVYRADPARDLALLKLEALPAGRKEVPYFTLAADVNDGEDCFVIGSQGNGPAWWIRSGNVSQQFDFPEGLSQFAAGVDSTGSAVDRGRRTVIVTDTRISEGDSGGPLLNARGELIGLTFATPANRVAGSVGWHVALQHLRSLAQNLPSQPESVPFDPWTAGMPQAAMLEPELADADRDGRIDSLRYRYAVQSEEANGSPRAVALTAFVDFSQRAAKSNQPLDHLPVGLWGMEDRGRFRFDLFLTTRADGVTAVGYSNGQGVVDEIRVGRPREDAAAVVWRRDASGKWSATKPSAPMALIDAARLGPANVRTLQAITGQVAPAPGGRRSADPGAGRQGPNIVR